MLRNELLEAEPIKEVKTLWCKTCNRETQNVRCEICSAATEDEIPVEVYWCSNCNIPIIKEATSIDKNICPSCGSTVKYLSMDLRPVFPEERLLVELLIAKPFAYINKSVWANNNRYYIDGKAKTIPLSKFDNAKIVNIIEELNKYREQNTYEFFNSQIESFIAANKTRLGFIKNEAYDFIQNVAQKYQEENIVISFSGGKDSTVTADLAVRALSNPRLVNIFGNTTLEFPSTIAYAERYRNDNPLAIFKIAQNKEQDFYDVCKDIGPPARMIRWCCSMFKTGPITRVLNSLYGDASILTFYGIRKCESVARSKYNRIENDSEAIKIQKQTVASPIFYWRDIDIWLYIFSEKLDFNEAYRLGYDRVGCWCCPNNNQRAQFLSQIYMPEQYKKWRDFLVRFAKQIGKLDAEIYVDSGKWKARQGGNGVPASEDVKIHFTNCTSEEYAKVYRLNKPITEEFLAMFIPFGKISKELGRKLINETTILEIKSKMPIISIQPYYQDGYEYSVKIKTMNLKNHEDLQRMIGYQVRKYNACRKCLKCESLCKYGAISIVGDSYYINDEKCKRCKMCVTAKYIDGGCIMDKYLRVSKEIL